MPRLKDAKSYSNCDRQTLLLKAQDVVTKELERCTIFDSTTAIDNLPQFTQDELVLGRILGRGGFCVVRECTSIRIQNNNKNNKPSTSSSNISIGSGGGRRRGRQRQRSDMSAASSTASSVKQQQQQSQQQNHTTNAAASSAAARGGAAQQSSNSLGGGGDSQPATSPQDNTNAMDIDNEEAAPPVAPAASVGGGGRATPTLYSRLSSLGSTISNDNNNYYYSSVSSSKLDATSISNMSSEEAREHLARRVWSKKGPKYVVKHVEPSLIEDDKVTFLKGTIDLALETYYLASLKHEHVLPLRGLSKTGPFEDVGYFIILDQLPEILSKRLTSWMHTNRATKGITGALTGGRRKITSLLTERLLVAYDIADAMDYIHSKNIIFRDLKPDNIGFDIEGTVKIFDFGLAKEMLQSEYVGNGLYRMTGFTGAIRYMAPEVGLREPYNLKADVYSWSMLMWYIMALEPPMGMYTPKMFIDRVFQLGYRPAINEKWPNGLGKLMKQSWSEEIDERPTFHEIKAQLKKELIAIDPQNMSFLLAGEVEG